MDFESWRDCGCEQDHAGDDRGFGKGRESEQGHRGPSRMSDHPERCVAEAVLNPLKVVITNYPEGEVEELEAVNNPEDESAGKRKVEFSKLIYIEQEDFREQAPNKYLKRHKALCSTKQW